MGDEGDYWRDVNAARKEKRASNLKYSTDLLKEHGVEFESKNYGVHLIIEHPEHGLIDFWPSTGLWSVRELHQRKRGVRNLLRFLDIPC